MNIRDINSKNIKEVELRPIGYTRLAAISEEVVNTYVTVEDGVVYYNQSDINLVLAHIYFLFASDLFEGVEISDEEVRDIFVRCDLLNVISEEFDFLVDRTMDLIRMIKRENSTEAILNKALISLENSVTEILGKLGNKIEGLTTKETIDAVTNGIVNLTRVLKEEDVNKIKSIINGVKDGIN